MTGLKEDLYFNQDNIRRFSYAKFRLFLRLLQGISDSLEDVVFVFNNYSKIEYIFILVLYSKK